MTVTQNIAFGLENLKWDKARIKARVEELLATLRISQFAERYPNELSGGQQQRVAIARTLAPGPKILFMDEPLSNLDAKLRSEMRAELKRLHKDTDSTFVYVTHDQLEAMTLSTRVCILNVGVLQQYEPPLTMYNRPANLFVADFMGNPPMNFIEGTAEINGSSANVTFGGLKGKFEAENGFKLSGKEVTVGIRPEHIHIGSEGTIEARVYSALPAGMETTVHLDIKGTQLTAVVFGDIDYPVDSLVRFSLSKTAILFDKSTGNNGAIGKLTLTA
jgi:multiple sugar transport system ATP-binding protein